MSDNRLTKTLRSEGNDGSTRWALGGLALLAAAALVGCGADKVAPADPTGLSAAAGNQLVTLNWIANTEMDLVGYDVHQGTASGALVKVASIAAPATSHVLAGLNNGTPYFFALAATDKAGNVSGLSAEVRAVPFAPDAVPPTLVASVPAPGASGVLVGTPITLTFSEDMDTASLVVTIAPLVDLGAPAWSDPRTLGFQPRAPLAYGTNYTLTVDGKDAAGNPLAGLKSFSFSTATETTAPAIPTGLSALPGDQRVTLTWDANTELDLAGYDVFQGTVSGTLTRVASLVGPATTHVATGLINGTAYFFAIAARDLAGNVSERTAEISGTPVAPDLMRPSVALAVPATTSGVARDTAITLSFSEDMDPGSVVVTIAPLPPLGELGEPLWVDGKTVTFQPTALLVYNTTYTLNVAGSDLVGLALQGTTTFSFTTANPPDLDAPTVLATGPADGATAVGVNTNLTFEFSEPMNQASVQGAFSSTPAVTCSWAVSADGRSFTCVHAVPFTFGASYVVTMGTGAMDLATNHLALASVIHFTAAAAPDTIRPVVCPPTGGTDSCPATSATFPPPGAVGVSRSTNIVVRFSEPMNQASVQAAFAITAPAGHSAGLFTWNAAGDTVTFNPDVSFAYGDNVTWRIGTGATDLASTPNALLNTFTSTFRVIRQSTGLIYSSPAIDGYILNTGALNTTFTYAAAGDTSANLYARGFFSFDLSPLPAATNVTAATLYVYQQVTYGTPYSDLGDLRAASVDYGSSLTAADFETPILRTLQCPPCVPPICVICNPLIYTKDEVVTLSTTSTVGTKSVDVARKVRDDLADGRSRAQFRVYFPTTTNVDGTTDDAILFTGETSNGSNRARLLLTYEYP